MNRSSISDSIPKYVDSNTLISDAGQGNIWQADHSILTVSLLLYMLKKTHQKKVLLKIITIAVHFHG